MFHRDLLQVEDSCPILKFKNPNFISNFAEKFSHSCSSNLWATRYLQEDGLRWTNQGFCSYRAARCSHIPLLNGDENICHWQLMLSDWQVLLLTQKHFICSRKWQSPSLGPGKPAEPSELPSVPGNALCKGQFHIERMVPAAGSLPPAADLTGLQPKQPQIYTKL